MKLVDLEYKEVKVETRIFTIDELKATIIDAYLNGYTKATQLINITSGDTVIFNSLKDVLRNDWSGNRKIELINLPYLYGTFEEMKLMIIFQEASDRIIG